MTQNPGQPPNQTTANPLKRLLIKFILLRHDLRQAAARLPVLPALFTPFPLAASILAGAGTLLLIYPTRAAVIPVALGGSAAFHVLLQLVGVRISPLTAVIVVNLLIAQAAALVLASMVVPVLIYGLFTLGAVALRAYSTPAWRNFPITPLRQAALGLILAILLMVPGQAPWLPILGYLILLLCTLWLLRLFNRIPAKGLA